MVTISEERICEYVGETVAEVGERRQSEGAVHAGSRRGDWLRARCDGDRPEPHRVAVWLEDGELKERSCSCREQRACEHVAAVLYEYLREPGSFLGRDERRRLLGQLGELGLERCLEVLDSCLKGEPELRWVVESEVSVGKLDGDTGIDELVEAVGEVFEAARSRARSIGGFGTLLEPLRRLVAEADRRVEDGRVGEASRVYSELVEVLWPWLADSWSGEEAVFGHFGRAVERLCRVFGRMDDFEERSSILRKLWELWVWDVESGGRIDVEPIEEVFYERTTPVEREVLADWLEEKLRTCVSEAEEDGHEYQWSSSEWEAEVFGGTLLVLVGDEMDDAEFVEIAALAGRKDLVGRRYLEDGRVDEAMEWAGGLEPRSQLELVDDFVELGFEGAAERVAQGLCDDEDLYVARSARGWLYDFYTERERYEKAVEVALERFRDSPGVSRLREVLESAKACGRREELEADLLNQMMEACSADLVRFYLQDDDPEAAVAIWASMGYTDAHFESEFAEAVASTHPGAAVRALNTAADRLIAARGRANYRRACGYLERVRDLCASKGQFERWRERRETILEEHSNLPAFQEEFRKAGLK